MSVAPPELDVEVLGSGPDLLFLPGMDGTLFCSTAIELLAETHRVSIPSLPGWGEAPRDPALRTVDDLSYAVLDLIDGFDRPFAVVGCSTGAWLATEVATKSCAGIASLLLVAPVGVRSAAPDQRSYLDLYASSPEEVRAAMYGKVSAPPDLSGLSDEQFLHLARAQEAIAYYAWEPYMHNPSLLGRLHRVTVPTLLVAGEDDGFTLREDHLALYEAELPRLVGTRRVPGVGHRFEEQAPAELAQAVADLTART